MYNKFKDCLIKPSKIYKYVDQKFGKKLLYFLLLVLIYVLPNIMTLTTFNGLNQNLEEFFSTLTCSLIQCNLHIGNFLINIL